MDREGVYYNPWFPQFSGTAFSTTVFSFDDEVAFPPNIRNTPHFAALPLRHTPGLCPNYL